MLAPFSLAGIPASAMFLIFFWCVLAPLSGLSLHFPKR